MIRTPSLRGRMVLVSILGLAIVTGTLDAFVFTSLRDRLEQSLIEVLDARAAIARGLDDEPDAERVAAELERAGVPAIVTDGAGATYLSDPPGRSYGLVPPGQTGDGEVERRVVDLGEDITVEVQVARGGTDRTLQRLLFFELVGTVSVLLLALVVLRRVAALVTRPVEQIVEVADAISAGDTSKRLSPTDPDTELGRMATAFDRTVDAMETAIDEARAAQASSRRFLSDAAHQLRTPLAGLRASAESLLRTPDAPDRDVMLANIARESVRATRLVVSLLQMARLDRGDEVVLEDVDLARVAREERDRAQTLAPELTVSLDLEGRDLGVRGDGRAIRDAIANLLDNARAHASTRLGLSVIEELGDVRIVVEDDGPGVPEGEEERVFERFVSLGGSGSGLGLAIARGVARSHGGDLTVEGARFELVIPRARI